MPRLYQKPVELQLLASMRRAFPYHACPLNQCFHQGLEHSIPLNARPTKPHQNHRSDVYRFGSRNPSRIIEALCLHSTSPPSLFNLDVFLLKPMNALGVQTAAMSFIRKIYVSDISAINCLHVVVQLYYSCSIILYRSCVFFDFWESHGALLNE